MNVYANTMPNVYAPQFAQNDASQQKTQMQNSNRVA